MQTYNTVDEHLQKLDSDIKHLKAELCQVRTQKRKLKVKYLIVDIQQDMRSISGFLNPISQPGLTAGQIGNHVYEQQDRTRIADALLDRYRIIYYDLKPKIVAFNRPFQFEEQLGETANVMQRELLTKFQMSTLEATKAEVLETNEDVQRLLVDVIELKELAQDLAMLKQCQEQPMRIVEKNVEQATSQIADATQNIRQTKAIVKKSTCLVQ